MRYVGLDDLLGPRDLVGGECSTLKLAVIGSEYRYVPHKTMCRARCLCMVYDDVDRTPRCFEQESMCSLFAYSLLDRP